MYKKMYLILFNAITEALKENNTEIIKKLLENAQLASEEICINDTEDI